MHDIENGHTCPTCSKSGILCTIEDGFCENGGECDSCIEGRYYGQWEYRIGGIDYEKGEPYD